MQTYYNIIYLPVFTINLASVFIIKPMFKIFGEYWNNKNVERLNQIILRMILLIVCITIALELVCMFIGIPILNLIYGVDLNIYKVDLLILVISGCFYAISVLMLNILTTMRRQKIATVIFFIISVITLIICNIMVKELQMRGASISNVIITAMLAIILFVYYKKEMVKLKHN